MKERDYYVGNVVDVFTDLNCYNYRRCENTMRFTTVQKLM